MCMVGVVWRGTYRVWVHMGLCARACIPIRCEGRVRTHTSVPCEHQDVSMVGQGMVKDAQGGAYGAIWPHMGICHDIGHEWGKTDIVGHSGTCPKYAHKSGIAGVYGVYGLYMAHTVREWA